MSVFITKLMQQQPCSLSTNLVLLFYYKPSPRDDCWFKNAPKKYLTVSYISSINNVDFICNNYIYEPAFV